MSFGFRKSIKIAPGVRMNLSKSGVGMSAGVKGARVGVNSKGTYNSWSIPGTGVYGMNYHSKSVKNNSINHNQNKPVNNTQDIQIPKSNQLNWLIGINIILLLVNFYFGLVTSLFSIFIYKKLKKKPEYIARKRIKEAEEAFQEMDFSKSAQSYSEAYTLFPDDLGLAFHLGMALSASEQFEKSIDPLNKYFSQYKDDNKAKYILAVSYTKLGETKKALALFQSIPETDEYFDINKLVLMAECLEKEGKLDLAIETLKTGPVLKRKMNENLAMLHYKLGELYEAKGDIKKATKHFEKVYGFDISFEEVESKLNSLEEK